MSNRPRRLSPVCQRRRLAETIVDALGRCDGDDAVWVFPLSDPGDGRLAKLLLAQS
ncbi:MAG: hypothetical protein IPM76_24305 [Chloroflexi bacterium]|nr:hypothetical protein [Chloroflexota bacterium]